ncbi:MAG: NADH dehydrogenase, partial [Lachnospiraceae bacterium]|nr:NADH dehydrogenase [Lachnospiraceae bacterium]
MDFLILFPVFLPVLMGAAMWLVPALKKDERRLKVYVLISLIIGSLSNLAVVIAGELDFTLIKIADGMSIGFKSDELSKYFAVLMLFVWVFVGIYAFGYMEHDKEKLRYFAFYVIVMGSLSGIYFSSNLVSLYLFYEMMTLVSLPLVIHTLKEKAVAAGYKYLYYSIAGALLALLGIFFFFRYTNSLDFVAGGNLNMSAVSGNEGVILTMVLLCIIGFGCKAGMFPLHGWLPTAHPEAPAPASAVLSGIITKSGVIAIIRIVYYCVGADFVRGTWVQYTWMTLALVTVFLGSMMAYREKVLKKRLAYSTVS